MSNQLGFLQGFITVERIGRMAADRKANVRIRQSCVKARGSVSCLPIFI